MSQTLSYRERRGHGGARAGSGRKKTISPDRAADLGQRIYETAFRLRREAVALSYHALADEILAAETVRAFRKLVKAHKLRIGKSRFVTDAEVEVFGAFGEEDPEVARLFTFGAVERWRETYRKMRPDHYREHFGP